MVENKKTNDLERRDILYQGNSSWTGRPNITSCCQLNLEQEVLGYRNFPHQRIVL
jgi:hypothetical protein